MDTIMKVKGKVLSTFDLKIIGIILMVVDHIHQMFLPFGAPGWLDWFGRPVATLFFFASAVGFSHTHSKKQYMIRLYISMVFMSLAMLGLESIVNYDQVVLINNIFRDLFVGAIFMYGVDQCKEGWQKHKAGRILSGVILFLLPFLCSLLLLAVLNHPETPRFVLPLLMSITPGILLAENTLMVLLLLGLVFGLLFSMTMCTNGT